MMRLPRTLAWCHENKVAIAFHDDGVTVAWPRERGVWSAIAATLPEAVDVLINGEPVVTPDWACRLKPRVSPPDPGSFPAGDDGS